MARKKQPEIPIPPVEENPAEPAKKSTSAEVTKRVNQVYQMLISSYSRAQIIQYASDKKWNVTDRTIDEYLSRARKLYDDLIATKREEQFNLSVARFTLIFQRTMNVMDYQRAIAAQDKINHMFGLYAPEKREVSGAIQQTNINIPAENAHDASDILKQLEQLGAIPPAGSEAGHNTEAE